MKSPDVVIVGGGIIGAACAFELASSGREVLVVERRSCWADECTAASAGLLCPSHATALASLANIGAAVRHLGRTESPVRIVPQRHLTRWLARFFVSSAPRVERRGTAVLHALATKSLVRLMSLAGAGVVQGVRGNGILYVHRTRRGFSRAVARASSDEGMANAEVLSGEEVAGVMRSNVQFAGGLLVHGEAHCDPMQLATTLGSAAREMSARVAFDEEVLSIRVHGPSDVEVGLRAGTVRANAVVVSAGMETARLVAPLRTRLPLLAGRGYALDIASEAPSSVPVFLSDERVVVTPLRGGARLSGTLELVPLTRPADERRIAVVRRAGDLVGIPPNALISSVRAGLRPCLPDGLPAVGSIRGVPNVLVATGHAMLGLTLAPATAEIVRRTLDQEPASAEALAISPSRFAQWHS